MLNPSDSIVDWVLKTVPTMGAGWCPPGMLGYWYWWYCWKAMMLAKESLMEEINMDELLRRGLKQNGRTSYRNLRKVNALGYWCAQVWGGLTTVLDIKIKDYPCHAAGKPVGYDSKLCSDSSRTLPIRWYRCCTFRHLNLKTTLCNLGFINL